MPEQWESFTELCNYFAFEGEIFDLCMSQFDMVMSHDIITLVDVPDDAIMPAIVPVATCSYADVVRGTDKLKVCQSNKAHARVVGKM